MADETPELRQIGFDIVEGPGYCVSSPEGARAYGCTETFTCADCNQVIGETEHMWIYFGEEPKPLWRHNRDCKNV